MVGVTGGRTAGGYFARYGKPVYFRLFSEMNNAANPYSAYNHDGSPRIRA